MGRKTFSTIYRRLPELMSKYNIGLKTILQEGLSEPPEFYDDLCIVAKNKFFVWKECHSLQNDKLKHGYSAANCMYSC